MSINGQQFSCVLPNTTNHQENPVVVTENTSNEIRNILKAWNSDDCLDWVSILISLITGSQAAGGLIGSVLEKKSLNITKRKV